MRFAFVQNGSRFEAFAIPMHWLKLDLWFVAYRYRFNSARALSCFVSLDLIPQTKYIFSCLAVRLVENLKHIFRLFICTVHKWACRHRQVVIIAAANCAVFAS